MATLGRSLLSLGIRDASLLLDSQLSAPVPFGEVWVACQYWPVLRLT